MHPSLSSVTMQQPVRFQRELGAFALLALVAVPLFAAISLAKLPMTHRLQTDRSSDAQILLTATLDNDRAYLYWSPVADSDTYRLESSPTDSERWQPLDEVPGTSAVFGPSRVAHHRFRVTALRSSKPIAKSAEVRPSTKRGRFCSFPQYLPWQPEVSLFCSWEAMNDWMKSAAIEAEHLRCRNRSVKWDASAPDCYYTAGDQHLVLLRTANDTYARPSLMAAATIRSAARRAIWQTASPFDQNHSPTPGIPYTPVGGAVTQASKVQGFAVRSGRVPGLISRISIFSPKSPATGRYAIYHEGHGGAAIQIGAETIDWLLDRGWTVYAMDMPLIGENKATEPDIAAHQQISRYDDGHTSPIAEFLLPVKAVVDHIFAAAKPDEPPFVLMIGRSGGGWTTYTYGAIDPRIALAVSISGGRPLSQRMEAIGFADMGDYEQLDPTLYNNVDHGQLMAVAGSRGALLVFNELDPCCFRVDENDPFLSYFADMGAHNHTVRRVFIDQNNASHSLSRAGYRALERFLSRFQR
jgi:dienelactone hydrolase